MKLYEINKAIEAYFNENTDPETGELLNLELLDALQMAREEKLESIGVALKNAKADIEALKAEKENLTKRITQAQKTAESIASYLSFALAGEKFKTSKVSVSYRASKSVVIDDMDKVPEQFIKVETTYTPSKTEIMKAIKAGDDVAGCHVEEKTSLIVR